MNDFSRRRPPWWIRWNPWRCRCCRAELPLLWAFGQRLCGRCMDRGHFTSRPWEK